jgi:hypothetical protein
MSTNMRITEVANGVIIREILEDLFAHEELIT